MILANNFDGIRRGLKKNEYINKYHYCIFTCIYEWFFRCGRICSSKSTKI